MDDRLREELVKLVKAATKLLEILNKAVEKELNKK